MIIIHQILLIGGFWRHAVRDSANVNNLKMGLPSHRHLKFIPICNPIIKNIHVCLSSNEGDTWTIIYGKLHHENN